MRLIKTEDAVGHVLCHDMTQIIKDQYKDARFRKGHVVTEEDIPVLLSMGKEHLYVWEMTSGMVHENDAAERLLALCGQENMIRSGVKEPICVTSSSVSPTRRRVPTGSVLSSMPRVLMFSAKIPASSSSWQIARIVSTLSSASRLIWRCQSPAGASPTMPWRYFTSI